jgi:hypothetical protein
LCTRKKTKTFENKAEKVVVMPESGSDAEIVPFSSGQLPGGGGTTVSMNINIYEYGGSIFSNASTICSKTCSTVAVMNYLYKNNSVVDSDSENNSGSTSAYVDVGGVAYISSDNYKATSSHGASNYYGYTIVDSQEVPLE